MWAPRRASQLRAPLSQCPSVSPLLPRGIPQGQRPCHTYLRSTEHGNSPGARLLLGGPPSVQQCALDVASHRNSAEFPGPSPRTGQSALEDRHLSLFLCHNQETKMTCPRQTGGRWQCRVCVQGQGTCSWLCGAPPRPQWGGLAWTQPSRGSRACPNPSTGAHPSVLTPSPHCSLQVHVLTNSAATGLWYLPTLCLEHLSLLAILVT